MSGQLEIYSSSEDSAASKSQTSSTSSIKRKCYELFFSCFRNTRKGKSEEDTTNCGSNDYDYIVEKLVIKRVPFVFSGIHTNTPDNYVRDIQQPLMKMNALETGSLLYCSEGLNQNTLPVDIVDESIKVDSNTATPNERNDTLSTNYDARLIELMNTLTDLHPDLKEYERPLKDPCPLSASTNISILSKNVEKIPAIKNGDRKRKIIKPENHVPGAVLMHKEFGDAKASITKSKTKQKIYYSRQDTNLNNKQWLVQSDQGMFYRSKNVTEFTDTNQLNAKDSDQKFKRVKSNKLNSLNNNTLDTKLRWKITVKHFKPKKF